MSPKNRNSVLLLTGLMFLIDMTALPGGCDRSLKRIQQHGVIKIGCAVETPNIFLKISGEVSGAETELTRVAAAPFGIPRIERRIYDFRQWIPALEDGQFEIIVAGMYSTPKPVERVSLSDPVSRPRHVTSRDV